MSLVVYGWFAMQHLTYSHVEVTRLCYSYHLFLCVHLSQKQEHAHALCIQLIPQIASYLLLACLLAQFEYLFISQ